MTHALIELAKAHLNQIKHHKVHCKINKLNDKFNDAHETEQFLHDVDTIFIKDNDSLTSKQKEYKILLRNGIKLARQRALLNTWIIKCESLEKEYQLTKW